MAVLPAESGGRIERGYGERVVRERRVKERERDI